jgi:regulator of protease activity HflC (stomatin/prohibitin superfamily)
MQGLLGGLPFELVIFIAVLVVIYVFRAIRIVQQYEKGLVETLGQYTRTASAGLVVIFPPFQALK